MKKRLMLLAVCAQMSSAAAEDGPRARDLGVPFPGTPGALNAITDVEGVAVGHETIIRDFKDGHAARTGVTAILPRGRRTLNEPVFAGIFSLNGNGEMTGAHWIEESGYLEGPVMITNTHSVGAVHDGVIRWRVAQGGADATGYYWSLPVVAETWDGHLNNINGFYVTAKHAARALEAAKTGPVAEGNVGGGTGMICHEFKCGIGTSSRVAGDYTVGVLVQANYGIRDTLRIAGVPVGEHLRNDRVYTEEDPEAGDAGSIIIVVATDAPLLPHQLKRLARRAALGIARDGSYAGNGSGDIFIAFSTAEQKGEGDVKDAAFLINDVLDPLFLATVEATEEAVINAMVAARDMTGDEGRYAKAIDHEALRAVLKQYGRLEE
ncbi:P1 family peptidase [Hyphococcus luteus]|uniref:Aminopeptidase n=1 Tax=Hyphococcus luteus TaxID=2058213 RepID=A0A2S7KA19_9PROT|nr:P1 family peptidase [Marinicaulis flavus]PQA89345.1 aminopeptidase [Marinicaulis flavus]